MISLVIGRQGSGKTLFLVKKAYDYYLEGKTIYSNIKLNFPFKLINYDDIIHCRLKNAVVIIDEVHLLLSSRNSLSVRNRLICDGFLSMVRKMGLNVLASTQTGRKVDIRFREEKDFLYVCNKYAYINNEWIEVLHNQNLNVDIPIMIHLDIREEFSMNWIAMSFIGNSYFNLFDTTEVVKIVRMDKEESRENKAINKLKETVHNLKLKINKFKKQNEEIKILNKLI